MDDITKVQPEKSRGGQWVRFGDSEYKVPPLSFGTLVAMQSDIDGLRDMGQYPSAPQLQTIHALVHSALVRNYPSIPREEVESMLDISNFQTVLSAVMSISGYKKEAASATSGEPVLTGVEPTAP